MFILPSSLKIPLPQFLKDDPPPGLPFLKYDHMTIPTPPSKIDPL